MVKVDIDDVLQGLIQPIGALKGGFDHPVTSADQIWVYTDPSTHVPLDEYLNNLETGTADTTGFFVSNATALTDGKITKASIVGGDVNKCKIGDIVLVADGGIYKIQAIDETNITLIVPALASYKTAAACVIKIEDNKYTSNIPLPTDPSIPVYVNWKGVLCPLAYDYQDAPTGHYFEVWIYEFGEALIGTGFLKLDGTVEISMDNSASLLTGPRPGILDKSYLIGVGSNGEEAIEIGNNLTLIDGVLSATNGSGSSGSSGSGGSSGTSGGGVNLLQATINDFDEAGDSKGTYTGTIDPHKINVVILPNPENKYVLLTKISDEGVGSAIIITNRQPFKISLANNEIHVKPAGTYFHSIFVSNDAVDINFNYYSTYGHRYLTFEKLQKDLGDKLISCSGFVKINNKFKNARYFNYDIVEYFDNDTGENAHIDLTGTINVWDRVWSVETGWEMDTYLDPK